MSKIKIPDNYNYLACFLTHACNLSCPYCINLNENGLTRRMVSKSMHISGEEWINFINKLEIRPDGLPVTLQGGEPTLHKDFYKIVNGIRTDIKLDLLTNLMFNVDEFIANVDPKIFNRKAKYAAIRASYHPSQNNIDDLVQKILKMADAGFYIGLYSVMVPENEAHIKEIQERCLILGIDFRVKEYLGYSNGTWYGTYRFPEAITQRHEKYCECKTTELIIGPDGSVYRCHADLYSKRSPIGSILNINFTIENIYRPCYVFGHCNPCDIKVKTNRFQEFGHSSVDIINIKELNGQTLPNTNMI
ncbi:MAG: radical SAM protein [Candidatus Acidulodesulfobacterium ferriphilum]|jgi:MoaA/NifB/PqqE/SkfB family radical SAM enzyme|uniref:Radical SAM protein n=1 Tax=Candidatus Acidulodesulfobacterium ferriphilum TaxID=2597223 RepID=A0A519BAE7_9DELT|nr:MAG: radical SAM protein [Candidatus Acidulodesulfobacterium ferriphilum]